MSECAENAYFRLISLNGHRWSNPADQLIFPVKSDRRSHSGQVKSQQRKARQQRGAFMLRYGYHWPANKTRWTQAHYNWLESLEVCP